ncbi:MAG TPA: N,N-dimethylformamidase beta subunit family domain-containing protein [Bryobacteraceae bacterium]
MTSAYCYTSTTSVFPGETIDFHASANPAGDLQLEIIRLGITDTSVYKALVHVGEWPIPSDAYANGCAWPAALESFAIPLTWRSGVYLVRFSDASGVLANTFFVVKGTQPTPAKILYALEVTTASAYNCWGGKSLYDDIPQGSRRSYKLSFDRPWTSRPPWFPLGSDSCDGSDGEVWLKGFYHPTFIQWLESKGFSVDFCTSIDLHGSPLLVNAYQLVLSVGHDEYWSKEMRDNLELFVANGGNAAFFSGNVCWWQIRLENNCRTVVCYKDPVCPDDVTDPEPDPILKTVYWYENPVLRPENRMTGVSSRDGAYSGNVPKVDYVVRAPHHWVFSGTDLADGAGFGKEATIIGYETDAANPADGTLPNFLTLADAVLLDEDGWSPLGPGNPNCGCGVTMGIFRVHAKLTSTDSHRLGAMV